ncbi:MAG: hypothetical protein C0467_32490 [Planctomycetaceae bacterium]|nr:hypothetical protein [Planctomycetaceae bacterium]
MSERISHVHFLPDPNDSGHPKMSVTWDEPSAVLEVTREDTSEMGQVPDDGMDPEPVRESYPLLGGAETLFLNLSAETRSAMVEGTVTDRPGVPAFLDRLEAHPEEVDGAGGELVAAAVLWFRRRLG